MVGLDSKDLLARSISTAANDQLGDALVIADGMSISYVRDVLEEQIAPVDSLLCHRFIEKWLARLSPVQRLAASMEVSHLYLLDLVDVPHAEDIILSRLLNTGADAIDVFKTELLSNRDIARNPDSSFGLKFVKNVESGTQDLLEAVIAKLRSDFDQLEGLIRRADGLAESRAQLGAEEEAEG